MATLGFNRTRLAGFAVSDLAFGICGVIVMAKLLAGHDRDLAPPSMRRASPMLLAGSIVLLTAGTVSSFLAWDALGSMQVVARFAWLTLGWFWILRSVCRDRAALITLLNGLRAGILVSSAIAVAAELGVFSAGQANIEGRQGAYMGHPNELGALLAIGLPLFILGVPRPPGGPSRAATVRRAAALVLVSYALATTGSMTATLSAAVGAVVIGVVMLVTRTPHPGRRHSSLAPPIAIAVAGAALFLVSNSDLPVVERFTRLQEGDSAIEGSISSREDQNDQAIARIGDTIIVGTGLQLQGSQAAATIGASREVDPEAVLGIHNMYLKVLHEAGLMALVGLLVVISVVTVQAWKLVIHTRGTGLHQIAVAMLAMLAVANADAMFHPMVYQRYYWVTVALIGCLWSVRRHEAGYGSPAVGSRVHEPQEPLSTGGSGADHSTGGRPSSSRSSAPRTSK